MLRSISKQSGESMESVRKKKRKAISLEWKSAWVMDDESGESIEPMEKCHSKNCVSQDWRD